ncbi:preprotein translocase subunit SecE [Chlamydia gallinacea]|uniref:Preprotein translocase subunit SecE n=2 Tax=Chlamydia gallinacea TaxID=1457153 RepID=A0A173DXX7_9CHLA|nr:preprotein translocase subunit SecE [Chlamydia gallinacea]ANG65782.1 preprotein translocase subunit SecE [Chlamydia gallinacea 08-1274/3]AQT77157.1 protein translocase subunit SecE [Chlamydia gallinacea]MBX6680339.1 preprotein translocase subunit SecE [Chlamydia gallinacea]MBX6687539.1 preprotein translocase subunit SecE [Chlamydia gallinacea]
MKQRNHQETISKKIIKAKKLVQTGFLDEIKKIEWVNKRDLKRYVKIVVASIFSFGFSIYCIDLILRKLLSWLGSITSFLFG